MMEVIHRQSPGSTANVIVEYPHEELVRPISDFSFACTVQPNTPRSGNQLPLDLSPADDIFFYGHLLPLHLFPHPPVSPRSSSPGTEFMQNQSSLPEILEPAGLPKSKSLGLFKRWRRASETGNSEETEKKKNNSKKKNVTFELCCLLKRHARLVRPLLIFSQVKRNKSSNQFKPQPVSYSGDLSFRAKQEMRGRRGEYSSAPASIRTSPVNSRILMTTANSVPSPTADSTMEELQSAIQAAIAHCKNSSSS